MNKSKGGASNAATTSTASGIDAAPRKSASRVLHEDRARFEAETAALGVAVRWEADEVGQPRAVAVNKLNGAV